MHPGPMDYSGRRDERAATSLPNPNPNTLSQLASSARPLRSEGSWLSLHDCRSMLTRSSLDSWIEISSRPSSSSLSSAGDNEVITTGLSIQNRNRQRRSLQIQPRIRDTSGQAGPPRPSSAHGSSQDEYDESESESDRVLSSSNEDIFHNQGALEDDDDNSTALGIRTSNNHTIFTPQPNAFSHPPSSNTTRSGSDHTPTPGSYIPTIPAAGSAPSSTRLHHDRTITNRTHTRTSLPQQTRSTQNSTAQPADHDAALRASLTTLLSCAAAVRGTPKEGELELPSIPRRTSRPSEPTTLRLVPESALEAPEPTSSTQKPHSSRSPKRKARESSKDRLVKKSRNATTRATGYDDEMMILSPTLMTWMISAGVVLVFSAISFSAGYAWGKEVGRFEGEMGVTAASQSCGQEAMKGSAAGLRRLRWSSAAASVRA